jgi:hypothetical protein
MTPVQRRLVAIAAGALSVVATFAIWVDATHLSMAECQEEEAAQYPRLEAAARQVLGGVGDRLSRSSFCEEAGRPRAYVSVSVYDWRSRKAARRYLRSAGVRMVEGEPARTADGIEVSYPTAASPTENDSRRFVSVTFAAPR